MASSLHDLLPLIDGALELADRHRQGAEGDRVTQLIGVLRGLRSQVQAGTLEPSSGGASLGLSRGVADWVDPLDSPLLKAVAAIEARYQQLGQG
ncbi:MAG: hypothetical protein VKI42_02675 [Synechococcaceae cyanobacterium]|nr:hypothetical protein [Synechococcaceae cyanobacterium]